MIYLLRPHFLFFPTLDFCFQIGKPFWFKSSIVCYFILFDSCPRLIRIAHHHNKDTEPAENNGPGSVLDSDLDAVPPPIITIFKSDPDVMDVEDILSAC